MSAPTTIAHSSSRARPPARKLRTLAAAIALPLAAFALQQTFWATLEPYSLVLFYPAVFWASSISLRAGIMSTIVAALLSLYFPPPFGEFTLEHGRHWAPVGVFAVMGLLFTLFHDRLRRTQTRLQDALEGERRYSAQVVEAGERRYQQILESVPQAVWTCDDKGVADYLSARWVEYTGIPEREQLGSGWTAQLHPDDREPVRIAWAHSVATGEPFQMEYRLRRHDGEYRWSDVRAVPLRDGDGRVVKWFGTNTDVHEAKATQLDLERYQQLVQGAREPLAMLDRDWRYVAVNAAYCAALRRTPESVVGQHAPELLGDEIAAMLRPHFERALSGETARFTYESSSDTGPTWADVSYHPFWRDGTVQGVILTAHDITAERRAQLELVHHKEHLEEVVTARTAELEQANRELESFAYAVTHDLRAPLRAMNGFSQALIEDLGKGLPEAARAYLDQIVIASLKMGELIDGLLVLSRSNRAELVRSELDLAKMAARILEGLASADRARSVHWTIEAPLITHGDPTTVEVVMQNLLSNAWKYTSKVEHAEIRVFSRQEGEVRFICVADNGAGFDMAHAALLFKPFQRLHRQEEFPGTGIGLATVDRIVRRHGGEVRAKGAVGRGAEIGFSLGPLAASRAS
ncbi:PAS domain-containing protein [Myxococcota bacterium]|nr:PAS domain-containing protein [Myxococcota bacterium]